VDLAHIDCAFSTGARGANPLDTAILKNGCQMPPGISKLDEIPFDFERRRHSVVAEFGGQRHLISQGAAEGVLAVCANYRTRDSVSPLDANLRAKGEETPRALAAQGYRVLAVAERIVESKAVYKAADECDMTLAGFLAFIDPPLADAAETIVALRRDGV